MFLIVEFNTATGHRETIRIITGADTAEDVERYALDYCYACAVQDTETDHYYFVQFVSA